MTRFALALVASLAVAFGARAADLPTGTWAANFDGTTGDLVIKEVKDRKVTGVMLGTDFTGTWDGKTLTIRNGMVTYEAQLVSEPGDKGKTKYTLTGTREERMRVPERVAFHIAKTGWYAQLTADAPSLTGAIKVEIRGVVVVKGAESHISVKRKSGSDVEETRVYFWASEGEWKKLQQTLAELDGKEVIVTGQVAQMPKGTTTSIPENAIYLLKGFEIKPAAAPAPNRR